MHTHTRTRTHTHTLCTDAYLLTHRRFAHAHTLPLQVVEKGSAVIPACVCVHAVRQSTAPLCVPSTQKIKLYVAMAGGVLCV